MRGLLGRFVRSQHPVRIRWNFYSPRDAAVLGLICLSVVAASSVDVFILRPNHYHRMRIGVIYLMLVLGFLTSALLCTFALWKRWRG